MKQELKQQLIKTLDFLKNHQDIGNLTLSQIQERVIEYEELLIEFVEKLLEDEETINGTLTTWWLYENVEKILYNSTTPDGTITPEINVESAEDFVHYMINSLKDDNKPVG